MTSIGNIEIQDLFVGSNNALGLYQGSVVVWEKSEPQPPQPTGPWLCFTANTANSTIKLNKVGTPDAISLETSTNGTTWTDYGWTNNTGDTLTMTNIGDKVYFRAKNENSTIGSEYDFYKFIGTGSFAASGNIQSLLKADCSRTDAPSYCYYSMFYGCSSLTSAPELPATTLASWCYSSMFQNCVSLTQAPALPATTLSEYCYYCMFSYCTSLTQAPALPATTLDFNCYESMFYGCSSLTSAPELPATTLPDQCYSSMFYDCTNLSSMEVSFERWGEFTPTQDWVVNAGSQASGTKTFKCPSGLNQEFGDSRIPYDWTVVTTD